MQNEDNDHTHPAAVREEHVQTIFIRSFVSGKRQENERVRQGRKNEDFVHFRRLNPCVSSLPWPLACWLRQGRGCAECPPLGFPTFGPSAAPAPPMTTPPKELGDFPDQAENY